MFCKAAVYRDHGKGRREMRISGSLPRAGICHGQSTRASATQASHALHSFTRPAPGMRLFADLPAGGPVTPDFRDTGIRHRGHWQTPLASLELQAGFARLAQAAKVGKGQ